MNILAIIPARKNSKGIVNKNIRLIKKKPLISYTIDSALKSKLIQDIYKNLKDPRIVKYPNVFFFPII